MTKTGPERRAFRFSSNRSASDRERIYLESFNVSVENRNWSKVGQTFSVAKEKEDERPLVEEFSTVCRPKLEEDEAKGRKSCKYFDDSVPRLSWNTAISSATAGFPQLFIEIVADADANADSDTDTGFVEPQLRYLFTSLRVFASCRFLLLPTPRLLVRILFTDGHVRCSNLSLDTCYQLRNYAKVRAYIVRNSRQDSYATRATRLSGLTARRVGLSESTSVDRDEISWVFEEKWWIRDMKFRSRQRGEYVSLLEMFRKVREHSRSIEVLMSRRVNDHCFSLFFLFSLFLSPKARHSFARYHLGSSPTRTCTRSLDHSSAKFVRPF